MEAVSFIVKLIDDKKPKRQNLSSSKENIFLKFDLLGMILSRHDEKVQ